MRLRISRKLLWQFVVPYLATLLLSAVMGTMFYRVSLQTLTDQWRARNEEMLREGVRRVDTVLSSFEEIVTELSQYEVFALGAVKAPISGSNVIQVRNVQKLLKRFDTLPETVWRAYLLYGSNDLAMDASNVFLLRDQYDSFLKPVGVSYAQWRAMLFEGAANGRACLPVESVAYSATVKARFVPLAQRKNVVCVTRRISNRMQSDIVLLFLLDWDALYKLFAPLDLGGGTLLVADAAGQSVAHWGDEAHLSWLAGDEFSRLTAENHLIGARCTSSGSGWQYRLVQSAELVERSLAQYKNLALRMLGAFLLVGLVLTVLLSYRSSKPLYSILARLQGDATLDVREMGEDMQSIVLAVDRLVENGEQTQKRLLALQPQLEQMLVQALLYDEKPSEHALEALAQQLQMRLADCRFGVSTVMPSNRDAAVDQMMRNLAAIPSEALRGRLFMSAHLDGYMVLLLIYPRHTCADARQAFAADVEAIRRSCAGECAIGIGEVADEAALASAAYAHAVSAMYRGLWQQGSGLFSDATKADEAGRLAESGWLKRAQTAILTGDSEAAQACLRELNTQMHAYAPLDKNALLFQLGATWVLYEKCAAMLESKAVARPFEALMRVGLTPADILAQWDALLDALMELCLTGRARLLKNERRQLSDMLEYVDANYQDANFSLRELADKLHLSVSSCSQQFKQADSRGFSVYLEARRIQAAQEILMRSDDSIEQIAMRVGYSSLSSFSRAFKRVHGVSASAYRKQRSTYIQ